MGNIVSISYQLAWASVEDSTWTDESGASGDSSGTGLFELVDPANTQLVKEGRERRLRSNNQNVAAGIPQHHRAIDFSAPFQASMLHTTPCFVGRDDALLALRRHFFFELAAVPTIAGDQPPSD